MYGAVCIVPALGGAHKRTSIVFSQEGGSDQKQQNFAWPIVRFYILPKAQVTPQKMHTDSETIFCCNFYAPSHSVISKTKSLNK